jgi:O-antigen ligase
LERLNDAFGEIVMSVDQARNRHVERLVVTSLVLLAALPAIMTVARASPPLIATIIALLLGIAAWHDGSSFDMIRKLKRFALGPAGMLLIAGFVLMALSLLWSPAPERALRHLFQLAGSALVIGVLLISIPWRHSEKLNLLMPIGLALAAGLVIVHFTMTGPVNTFVGVTAEGYYLNRTAVALTLFAPVVLTVLWRKGSHLPSAVLGIVILVAIWLSDSWSAKLASLVIAGSVPLSLLAPRRFHMVAVIAMLVALLAVPLYVGFINNLIPHRVHEAVGYGSLTVRGEIWREYVSLIWHRPILGFGLEASNVIARTEYAAGMSEAQIHLLSYGHPHNALVQIWFEFGLAGALIAASLLGRLFGALTRLEDSQLSMATTTALGVYTVACVSHGAWQAWWICLVGLAAFAFMLQMMAPSPRDAQEFHASELKPREPQSAT